jgi:signal transduction histidine kinase
MTIVRARSGYGLENTPVVAAESEWPGAAAARVAARAHAQKNCAAVILAIARLTAPDLPPRQRERFERLEAAATRLVTLLNDEMRDVAAAAGAELKEVDVGQLVGAARDLVRDRAEAGAVSLVVSCAGGRTRGDPSALTEVLVNLIGNAIDASPAGQSVRVDARIASNGSHRWVIEDAGRGMPAHVLAGVGGVLRSAQPFGSGFGIALASKTIRAHGGTLQFESRAEGGTRAVIDLPGAR